MLAAGMALLIGCQNLKKSFGHRPLFENISLGISDNDKIGLIGPNGAGKSTFLKILAGEETPDDGEVSINRKCRVCYLPQNDVFAPDQTVQNVLLNELKNEPGDEHEKEVEVAIMLSKVGFDNENQLVKNLSGGWRKRLAIARALIKKPDLLLLDEPTNHLDLNGVIWLEKFLKNAPFAYLAVSHDRYFLENISSRVIELNRRYPQGHFSSVGAYSTFLEKRDEFLLGQLQQQETLANKVRREVEWLRRGPKARTTKANARIKEAHNLIENLDELKYRNAQSGAVEIDFSASARKTKKLLVVENLKKSFGEKVLFQNLSLSLSPKIRLGLLGNNGSGKTSLIKIIMGQLPPDSGKIDRADKLRIVYFDQTRDKLDDTLTLRRALAPHGDQVVYQERPIHVATWAQKFLFSSEQLNMPIRELSGGERARILIARLMLEPADILILDEPTNDLDIPTLEVLEDSLTEFAGALVLVTHDRYLLDRVSTHLLALDGKGTATYYADYAQWESDQQTKKNPKSTASSEKAVPTAPVVTKPRKLSYKEQTEWDGIEAKILAAEQELAKCHTEVENLTASTEANKMQAICAKLQQAQENVDTLYHRWTELEKIKNGG